MTSQAKKEARAELVTRLFILVLLALLAAAVVTIFQVRSTQLEGTPLGKQLASSANRILDCTDSAGDCYQRGQKRTASAVQQIAAGNILAVVCALQVPNGTPLDRAIDQVTACVAERLSKPTS